MKDRFSQLTEKERKLLYISLEVERLSQEGRIEWLEYIRNKDDERSLGEILGMRETIEMIDRLMDEVSVECCDCDGAGHNTCETCGGTGRKKGLIESHGV